MKRLLVGVDDSASAVAALQWTAAVADRSGADVVVVGAWTPNQAELPPDEFGEEHASLRETIDATIARVSSAHSPHVEIVDGEPVDVLLERADAEDADLVVVGIEPERRSHTTVALELAHRIIRPLAAVPTGATFNGGRLVLGVDDADGSPTAVAWCAKFAAAVGSPVTAACVYAHQYELYPDTDERSLYGHITRALDEEWLGPLDAAGVDAAREVVRDRHVPEGLLEAVEHNSAEVLVVGAHGFAPLVHRRLGGVAMRLLHSTSVPVVLVPQY